MLEDIIRAQIKQNGPMPLGEFMNIALGHPEHGYYMRKDPFGKKGDFTTAPEISQIFGELIGAWVLDIWLQMGSPELKLIECGPGRGTLMNDIVRILSKNEKANEAISMHLVETSTALIAKQKQALKGTNANWYNHIGDIPNDKPTIIIANEFLDALPIEQLKRTAGGWMQKHIVLEEGGDTLTECWQLAPKSLQAALPQKTVSGEIYEIAPDRTRYVKKCAEIINQNSGVALLIDYGHTKTHHGDTLQTIRNHEYSELLSHIGDSDITAHVDFETTAKAAQNAGVKTTRTITQAEFLNALGGQIRCNTLTKAAKSQKQVLQIQGGYRRLTDKNEMGDLFKALCFYKGAITPAGF